MKKKHQEWFADFLKNCAQINRAPLTIKNYEADLRKFIAWFERNHSYSLAKASGDTISNYKEFLSGILTNKKKSKILNLFSFFKKNKEVPIVIPQRLSVGSQKRHLSTISNFFEFLKQTHEDKSRLFNKNPVKTKIHSIKLKEIDVMNTPNIRAGDWEKIQKSVYRTKERLIIYLLYYGGLRLTELTDLRVENFDSRDRSLKFTRKGGYIHHLQLHKGELIFTQLDYHLRDRKHDSNFIFANKSGKKLSSKTLYNIIMKIFQKAGCTTGLTPHSFRKACATNLYVKTKDLLLVRDYLNHKDAKVTQTYIDKITLEGIKREEKIIS